MPENGNLIVNLYHALNLIPGDDTGNSDPYFVISYYGKEIKSSTIYESTNPIFNEKLCFENVPIFKLD